MVGRVVKGKKSALRQISISELEAGCLQVDASSGGLKVVCSKMQFSIAPNWCHEAHDGDPRAQSLALVNTTILATSPEGRDWKQPWELPPKSSF